MVCYEVNLVSVNIQAKNPELLIAALKEIGYNAYQYNNTIVFGENSIDLKRGTMNVLSNELGNKIKRKYSLKMIEEATKKNKKKWRIRMQSETKLQLRRG